ncbi:MAG: M20/M25/M40 family metallo-hydrolase [Actinomycetota bacterium]|nr:M20/M25/M40 family metallo-hydrolase [Actinomycetota bacterium]
MYKINEKRLLNEFFKILSIKSPTKKEGMLAVYLEEELKKTGLQVSVDDTGKKIGGQTGNIIAKFTPKFIKNNQPIFLSAHMDTVSVEDKIVPFMSDDMLIKNKTGKDILGADDKAAIAAIIEAIKVINEFELQTGIIYIILTVGEETGLLGSKHIDMNNIEADVGFVFDADGDIGTVINKAPFHNRIDIKVIGKASHAGVSPEKGINSIKAAAFAICNTSSGRIDEETTCNIGKIKGGIETNVVPETTIVNIEARSMHEEKLEKVTKEIVDNFRKATDEYKAKLEYEISREYDGYSFDENNIAVKTAKRAIEKIGIKPRLRPTGGGSDTNNFNAKNKIAINLASGFENCHSVDEYISFNELIKLAKLIIEICIFGER